MDKNWNQCDFGCGSGHTKKMKSNVADLQKGMSQSMSFHNRRIHVSIIPRCANMLLVESTEH